MRLFALMGAVECVVACTVGCTVDSTSSEPVAHESAAVCSVPDATTAAVAELAATIGVELHRWEMLADFRVYTGYGNRSMLGLTAAGLAQCGGSCPLTSDLLTLQDARTDQTVVFDGVFLSASSFASTLVAGFASQQTCVGNGQCPYEAHVLDIQLQTPGTCQDFYTYLVSKPGGGNLNNVANLDNALFWTANNPLIAFQNTATSVTIDPTGQLNPVGQATGATEVCQKASYNSLVGTPCICAANNVFSDGLLLNDDPVTPRTYYCRQSTCQKASRTNINGQACSCSARNIFLNGQFKNDDPVTPSTYYCRQATDLCQSISTPSDNLNGTACTCPARNISSGHLSNAGSLSPDIYYCQ